MKRMIAITIRPGAVTAAVRLMAPFDWALTTAPPAPTSTRKKVPRSSLNRRRHSWLGSSKSADLPNSSSRRWWVRRVTSSERLSAAGWLLRIVCHLLPFGLLRQIRRRIRRRSRRGRRIPRPVRAAARRGR